MNSPTEIIVFAVFGISVLGALFIIVVSASAQPGSNTSPGLCCNCGRKVSQRRNDLVSFHEYWAGE